MASDGNPRSGDRGDLGVISSRAALDSRLVRAGGLSETKGNEGEVFRLQWGEGGEQWGAGRLLKRNGEGSRIRPAAGAGRGGEVRSSVYAAGSVVAVVKRLGNGSGYAHRGRPGDRAGQRAGGGRREAALHVRCTRHSARLGVQSIHTNRSGRAARTGALGGQPKQASRAGLAKREPHGHAYAHAHPGYASPARAFPPARSQIGAPRNFGSGPGTPNRDTLHTWHAPCIHSLHSHRRETTSDCIRLHATCCIHLPHPIQTCAFEYNTESSQRLCFLFPPARAWALQIPYLLETANVRDSTVTPRRPIEPLRVPRRVHRSAEHLIRPASGVLQTNRSVGQADRTLIIISTSRGISSRLGIHSINAPPHPQHGRLDNVAITTISKCPAVNQSP